MTKTIILFLIFSFFTNFISGQNKISILENKLATTTDKNEQTWIKCRLAKLYITENLNKSFEYLDQIKKDIKKNKVDNNFLLEFYETYAEAYYYKLDYKNALNFYKKAFDIAKKQNNSAKADTLLYNMATIYYKKGDLKKSQDKFEELLTKAINQKNTDIQKQLLITLYKITYERKKYKSSVNYLQDFIELQSSEFYNQMQKISILRKKVRNYNLKLKQTQEILEETTTELKQTDSTLQVTMEEKLRLENDTLKKALEIERLAVEKAKKDAQIIKQNLQLKVRQQTIIYLTLILILLLLSGFYIFMLYKRIKKQNILLSEKNKIIKEKNQQIIDSLNYAATIQTAIMPNPEKLKDYFDQSYIFFKPRDIVSGDFYWFMEKSGRIFVAAVDCTGHGVPGAMLSMIGNALLNKIIIEKEIYRPAEILNILHFETLRLIAKNNTGFAQNGMDMVICSIDKYNNDVVFAGAKNKLFALIDGKIQVFKSSFASVGYRPLRQNIKIEFSETKVPAIKGDYLFLCSDGISDQFGIDENGNEVKFNLDRFEKMLLEAQNMSIEEHEKFVINTIKAWQQNVPQTDDMLLITIRL